MDPNNSDGKKITLSLESVLKEQPKYLYFFLMLFMSIFIICDITAFRMVDLFGQPVPASGLIIPLVFWLGDIIAEVYGYRVSRKMIWNLLICQLIFGLFISFVLTWPSPPGNTLNESYSLAFENIIRTNLTSCFSVSAGMFTNAILISKLKIRMNGKRFWLRAILSSAISELVLCIVAYFLLYLGLKDTGEIINIILFVWFYRLIFSILTSPIASPICKILKRLEKRDVYDHNMNYNPLLYND